MFPPALPNTPEGTINFSKVPRHIVLAIGETFCKEVAAFKKQPGGQAHLDEKAKRLKKEGVL